MNKDDTLCFIMFSIINEMQKKTNRFFAEKSRELEKEKLKGRS